MSSTYLNLLEKHFSTYKLYNNDRKGTKEFVTTCPFCNKTEKLWINTADGICKCWSPGCEFYGKGGTIENLFIHLLGMSYAEAKEYVEGNVNLNDLTELTKTAIEFLTDTKRVESILTKTWDLFPEGCSKVTVEDNYFVNWLTDIRKPSWNPKWFLERFPIYKLDERPFKSRAIFEITSGENRAYLAYGTHKQNLVKVLNPEGQILSNMLFNYNSLSRPLMFVCEGIFSAARVIRAGFDAVCTFGVSMSSIQAYLINKSPAKDIVFLYDYGAFRKAYDNASLIVTNLDVEDKCYFAWEIPFYKDYTKVDETGKEIQRRYGYDPDDLGTKALRKYLLYCIEKQKFKPVRSGFSRVRAAIEAW